MSFSVPAKSNLTDPSPLHLSTSAEEHCVALALHLCRAAAVHLVCDLPGQPTRRWSALRGPDEPEVLRDIPSWAGQLGDGPLVVIPDTLAAPELAGHFQVEGDPNIRSAARISIQSTEHSPLGMLWLLDTAPDRFGAEDLAALGHLVQLTAAALSATRAAPLADVPANPIVRLRALLRNATDLVAINDARGIVQYISPSVTRILGYQPDDLIGRSSFDLLHPEDVAAIVASAGKAATAPGSNPPVHMRFRNIHGHWRILEASSTNMLDDPHVRGMVVNARDVTEKVQAQEDQQACETRFLAIFQTAPMGIVVVNEQEQMVLVNPAFAELFGYSVEELVEQPLELVLLDNRHAQTQYHVKPDGQHTGVGLQLSGHHRDGTLVPIDVSLNTFDQAGERLSVVFVADSRSRQQMEHALRESEERYRRLVDLAPDAVLVSRDEQLVFINQTGLQMLGARHAEEVVGMSIWAFVNAEEKALVKRQIQRVASGEALAPAVYQAIGLNGTTWLTEAVSTTIQYDGAPAILTIARDITERLDREQQIRFQANVLSQMSDAVVVIDSLDQITYLNAAAERLYGMALTDMQGQPLGDLYGVEFFEADDEESARRTLQETGLWRGECRHHTKQGHSLDVEAVVGVLRSEHGAGGGVFAVIRDITARKQVEERLLLLESVVVNALDAVVVTEAALLDRPGPRIRYVNDAFTRITGYPAHEVIGVSPRMLQGPQTDPQTCAAIRAALLAREPMRVEILNYTKSGAPIWIDLSIVPVMGKKGQLSHFVAIQRDITERKQLEARLLQAQRLESIGRLAGGIAHDFNNLLMAIGGYADMVCDAVAPDSPSHSDALEIRGAVDRATALTRQLLAFARRQPRQPQTVQLNTLIGRIGNLLRRLLGADITMHTLLAPQLPSIFADPGQIEQVLINLVVNARDAMPDGGTLVIRTEVVPPITDDSDLVSAEAPTRYVRMLISDTGTGMTPEVQSHAFEPFFTSKATGQGTGLGLATCHGIVLQHDGTIELASQTGAGTTVIVSLPALPDEAAESIEPVAHLRAPGGSETVLVVDDEPAVRALASRMLATAGYNVLTATSGASALRLLQDNTTQHIQILLTDLQMPEMNGRVLANEVAERYPDIRIIHMSGNPMVVSESIGVSQRTLIIKPFSAPVLLQIVRSVLDGETPYTDDKV